MKRSAFSLVELSIVLVILGLLVGGILAGQSLIRAAELRKISSDLQQYSTSLHAFRDKYFALPGDMANATAFWGIRTGSGSTTGSDAACWLTLGVRTGTCNGDGNGKIQGTDATEAERYLSFQHLSYAGLIASGGYTGASTSNSAVGVWAPTNAPYGPLGTMWSILYFYGPLTADAHFFDGAYNTNAIRLYSNATAYKIIKPAEMWNLDTKMDDGKPATGILWVYKSSSSRNPLCATSDMVTANYSLDVNDPVCSVNMSLR